MRASLLPARTTKIPTHKVHHISLRLTAKVGPIIEGQISRFQRREIERQERFFRQRQKVQRSRRMEICRNRQREVAQLLIQGNDQIEDDEEDSDAMEGVIPTSEYMHVCVDDAMDWVSDPIALPFVSI